MKVWYLWYKDGLEYFFKIFKEENPPSIEEIEKIISDWIDIYDHRENLDWNISYVKGVLDKIKDSGIYEYESVQSGIKEVDVE